MHEEQLHLDELKDEVEELRKRQPGARRTRTAGSCLRKR